MKKIIIAILLMILCFLGYIMYNNRAISKPFLQSTYEKNMHTYIPEEDLGSQEAIKGKLDISYRRKGNQVFFQGKLLEGVSPKKFILLGQFAIDANKNVYRDGYILSGIDGNTVKFYPYNWFYISDADGNYFLPGYGDVRKIATQGEFHTFLDWIHIAFAYDDNNVYANGHLLSGASPDDITLFENSPDWIISSGMVFLGDRAMTDIDVDTFQPSSDYMSGMIGYAEDKNHKYLFGRIIDN